MSLLRLTPGAVFAGDFEILRPLAEGGMGSVYVAKQLSTGKERALKIMQPGLARDPRTRDRFTREARAGSQVDSEHVVEVVAAGIDSESGTPWLAMELLRGEDLAAFSVRNGPLSLAQTLEIFRQLCHGLSAAHASGLVHRDLKPENVFLATARRVGVPFTLKILDFGIAKVVQETKRDVTDAVGTPIWMSPEQTEAGRAITPASDVWALGLICFFLLTGRTYWKSANVENDVSAMAILREVVFESLEPASIRARAVGSNVHLGTDFDGWFARCVVRDPERRFANASAALAALEPILAAAGPGGAAVVPSETDAVASTVRGAPFRLGSPPSPTLNDALPATRVGPFTGPTRRAPHPSESSLPPREDIDHYEKRLAGGRKWVWAGLLSVLALGAYAAVRVRDRMATPPPFTGNETEPNNRAPEANALPFGKKIRGQIGQRLDATRSDRDFFRTSIPASAHVVGLRYGALTNIAPCILTYRLGTDEPILRFCLGQPHRDLTVPQLRLAPGDYLFAVLQDREQYTEEPPAPVLENVSDAYDLEIGSGDPAPDIEIEPNDQRASANTMKTGSVIRGRIAWMRDTDVICSEQSPMPIQFVVEDLTPRPRGGVLEVTAIGGPTDGIPVRVHHPNAEGQGNERDVRSPWKGPELRAMQQSACIALTLTRDVWATPPLPRVPEAGDQEYVVRLEAL